MVWSFFVVFFFQAEDGIRDLVRSRGLGDVYKRQLQEIAHGVPFEEVHRMLSVLIHSEEDVKFSSLSKVTIETVLLRIMSAPDLADIQQLIQAATARHVPAPARQAAQAPVAQEKYRKPISALPQSWDGVVS